MSNDKPTPLAPVTLRLDRENRELLEDLSRDSSASAVLRLGLQTLARLQTNTKGALYPVDVDEPHVKDAITRAAKAAVETLDELFEGKKPESAGISSNFHGLLEEHLRAMLLGREAAYRTHRTHLNALFADHKVFGEVRQAQRDEGYCLAKQATTLGQETLYFDSDRNRFVELFRVEVGSLYTSVDAAIKAGLAWLKSEELSPREHPLRLCILGWDGSEKGIFLREIAR